MKLENILMISGIICFSILFILVLTLIMVRWIDSEVETRECIDLIKSGGDCNSTSITYNRDVIMGYEFNQDLNKYCKPIRCPCWDNDPSCALYCMECK